MVLFPLLAMHPVAYSLVPLKRGALLVAVAALLLTRRGREVLARPMGGPAAWLGAFVLLYAFTGMVSSGHWFLRLEAVLQMIALMVLGIAVRDVFWEHGEWMLRTLTWVALGLAAVATLQKVGVDLLYGDGSALKPVATVGNTNAWAAWVAPVLAIALSRSVGARPGLAFVAVLLLTANLVQAGARGGMLAALLGLMVVTWTVFRRGESRALRPTAIALGLGLVVGFVPGAGGNSSDADPVPGLGLQRASNVVRLEVARASLAEAADAPFVGVGPGQFAVEYPQYRRRAEATIPVGEARSVVDHPHNEWLRIACESGLLAALLLMGVAIGVLLHLRRPEPAYQGDPGTGRLGLLAALVATLGVSATWSNLWDPATGALCMFLLGGALASRVEFDEGTGRVPRTPVGLALAGLLVAVALPSLVGETLQARAVWTPLRAAARSGTPVPDADRMLDRLERAAELDPYAIDRQAVIGGLLLSRSRQDPANSTPWLERAATCFHRLRAVHPHHTGMLWALAEIDVRRRQPQRAWVWLQQLSRLEPWSGDTDALLAELVGRFGRPGDVALTRFRMDGADALPEVLAQAAGLREAGDTRAAALLLDQVADAADEDLEFHRENARVLKALGDDPGYREAMRRAQLLCAVESLALNELDVATGNVERARRYVEPGQDEAENLLGALVKLRQGSPRDAAVLLAEVPERGHEFVPAWVVAQLDDLFDHPSTFQEMRRIGIPLATESERR